MSRAQGPASPPLQPHHLVGLVHGCPGQPAPPQGRCGSGLFLCPDSSSHRFCPLKCLLVFGVWLFTTLRADVGPSSHTYTPPHSPSFLSFGPECGMQRALSEHYSPWGRWAWCRGIESGCLHLLPGIQAQGRPELASAPTSHLQPPGPTRAGVPHQGRALLLLHPYGWKAGVQWGLNLPGPAGVFGADRPPTLFPSHLLPPRSTGEWVRPTD